MTTEGFVKVPRTMLEWGWLDDGNTLKVYMVLLLSANWKDTEWHGIKLKRGQLITSVNSLCEKCRLTSHKVRTALEHLCASNDIAIKTTSQFTIVTLNNYDFEENSANETSNQPQTNVNQTASQAQTNVNQTSTAEERKEEKETKEKEERKEAAAAPPSPSCSSSKSVKANVTREELAAKYGEENVLLYETKFDNWASKKGITDYSKMYSTIAKWLDMDNVLKPRESSFKMGEVMEDIKSKYKTKLQSSADENGS